jgi:hypothetical protein
MDLALGTRALGYEVAGSNIRETYHHCRRGGGSKSLGIALYILVICDRLCIACIEMRHLIVVVEALSTLQHARNRLSRASSIPSCCVHLSKRLVIETPDVLLVLTCHWMGACSDVTYRSSSPEVLVWMSSGLGSACLASSLQYLDTLVN